MPRRSGGDGQRQPLRHVGPSHHPAVTPGQQRRIGAKLPIELQPLAYRLRGALPQRKQTLLAPFAVKPDPYANLRDVLERLPTLPASRIADLLTHRWQLKTDLPA